MTAPPTAGRARPSPATALAAAALVAAGLAACGGSTPKAAAPAKPVSGPTVTIDNFQFSPNTIRVPVGGTVTWVNRDVAAHDVKFAGGGIPLSPMLLANTSARTWSHTFAKAGTYSYVCGIHPYMHGQVVVGP